MRVVIVGAGHDGSFLAERLIAEGQDVVIIEVDEGKAAAIQDRLDALVITGNGASPSVLKEAGVDHCGLFLGVSDSDGANVMACHTAKNLGATRTVARVEDPDLREISPGLGVDVIIDARESVAREAAALVRHVGVSELVPLAGGRLALVGGTVRPDAPSIGYRVADLRHESKLDWTLAAVVRGAETTVGRGEVTIRARDHALIVVQPHNIRHAMGLLGIPRTKVRRAVILGGTSIGRMTANRLVDEGHDVIVVDADPERCLALSKATRALIINGDPADADVLERLELGANDVVLGLSGRDQVNLMGCMVAKATGAGAAIARFGRARLATLLKNVGVDAIVSSRVAAADAILRFVRRDRILSVATFKDTDAELIEVEIAPGSPAAGKTVSGLGMPNGTVIGGLVRSGESQIPTGATRLEAGDRAVVFAERKMIDTAEELFLG